MKCKICNNRCQVWWWQDGGAKGIICSKGHRFWSDKVSREIYIAQHNAVIDVMDEMTFPKDALTQKEWEEKANKS